MSGDRISHYELLDKLGEGGMGVLYRARDLRLNRTVAIKVLRPEAAGDPELTRRLLQEARAASALNHPHIVTINDVDDRPELGQFIAMEYIEGEPLTRLLSRGPLCASRSRWRRVWQPRTPYERGPSFGFRCARYDTPPPQAAFEPIEQVFRDYARERPASDEAFATFARLYAYDPAPLEARSSGPDDDAEGWRMERVSFAAVYGGERIPARLYVPRHVKPPYQAVLYSPSGATEFYKSIERFPESEFSFLVRSGRAVLFPVYQNTFERSLQGPRAPTRCENPSCKPTRTHGGLSTTSPPGRTSICSAWGSTA